ncbi:unnamed protein product [Orchesella dallaii]|uniref:C2H2-type domain-containing protein n=1 Tax=Orchesella dallaii TaxID=48710 RepID=A0ABP1RQS0_9HEXA
MTTVKGVKHVCFICLKQFKFTKETEQLLESRGHTTPPQIYKKFITFATEYLQLAVADTNLSSPVEDGQCKDNSVGGGGDHNQSVKIELVCELCATEVSKVFKIYKELLEAEIRLSAKLEEVGNLIKESSVKSEKVVSSSLTFLLSGDKARIGKVEKLRSEIVLQCFQKRGQTSEFLDTQTQKSHQPTAEGDNNDDDEDIKPDLEILEHEVNLHHLNTENTSELQFEGVNHDANEKDEDGTFNSFLIPDVTLGAENDDDDYDGGEDLGESDADSDPSFEPSPEDGHDDDGSKSSSSSSVENLTSEDEEEFEVELPLKKHRIGVKSSVPKKSQAQQFKKKKIRRPYPCPYCRSSFNIPSERTHHIQSRHKKTSTFYCDNDEDTKNGCTAVFSTQSELNSHLQTHSKPIHSCSYCEAMFLNPDYLKLHEIFHIKWTKGVRPREVRLLCPNPSCNVYKSGHIALQSHYNIKHGRQKVKFFKCLKCKERLLSHYKLKSHMDAHDNPKPVPNTKCPHCDVECLLTRLLNAHIKKCKKNPDVEPEPEPEIVAPPPPRPVGDLSKMCGDFVKGLSLFPPPQPHSSKSRPNPTPTINPRVTYTCKVCGEVVKGQQTFKAHVRNTHPQKKAMEHCMCEVCGDSFDYRSSLATHTYHVHGEGRFISRKRKNPSDFVCSTCGKGYTSRTSLRAHEVVHLGGEKERKFACHLCPVKFIQKNSLRKHLVKVHMKVKGQEFTPGEGLPRKDWKCQYTLCKEEFFEESELKAHVGQTHFGNTSQFVCLICGRLFANQQRLTRHNVVHTKEKPYKCDKCPKAYSLRQTLVEHVREVHSEGGIKKEEEIEWPCTQPGCDSTFRKKDYMQSHLRLIHKLFVSKKVKTEGN